MKTICSHGSTLDRIMTLNRAIDRAESGGGTAAADRDQYCQPPAIRDDRRNPRQLIELQPGGQAPAWLRRVLVSRAAT